MIKGHSKIAGIQLPPLLAEAVRECRGHFIAAAAFSLCLNVLYLASPIDMLQVYDRVVPTGGVATLAFITLALAIALVSRSAVDAIRLRLLERASLRLEAIVTPRLLKQSRGPDASVPPRPADGRLPERAPRAVAELPDDSLLGDRGRTP